MMASLFRAGNPEISMDGKDGGGGGDAAGVVFDSSVFCDACNRIFSRWEAHGAEEGWGSSADALAIVSGVSQEDVITFPKSLALHAGKPSPPLLSLHDLSLLPPLQPTLLSIQGFGRASTSPEGGSGSRDCKGGVKGKERAPPMEPRYSDAPHSRFGSCMQLCSSWSSRMFC